MELLRSRKKKEPRGVFHLHLVSLAFISSSLSLVLLSEGMMYDQLPVSCLLSFIHVFFTHRLPSGVEVRPLPCQSKGMTKKEFKSCISDPRTRCVLLLFGSVCSQTVILTPFSSTHSFLKVLLLSSRISYPLPLIHLFMIHFSRRVSKRGA